jgi:hypothetical protein
MLIFVLDYSDWTSGFRRLIAISVHVLEQHSFDLEDAILPHFLECPAPPNKPRTPFFQELKQTEKHFNSI